MRSKFACIETTNFIHCAVGTGSSVQFSTIAFFVQFGDQPRIWADMELIFSVVCFLLEIRLCISALSVSDCFLKLEVIEILCVLPVESIELLMVEGKP